MKDLTFAALRIRFDSPGIPVAGLVSQIRRRYPNAGGLVEACLQAVRLANAAWKLGEERVRVVSLEKKLQEMVPGCTEKAYRRAAREVESMWGHLWPSLSGI
jgi:hypothetical protein